MNFNAKYRPEIDGLRALAVLPVILFHAGYTIFSGGFVGVDIFFVISGYLITGIIWSELRKGEFSIIRFYERRARRILPALILVLSCCSVLAFLWMMPGELKDFAQSLLASLTFGSNIYFWQSINYFSPSAAGMPLLHLWSLGIEEQFYLLFPIAIIFISRIKETWVLPIIFSALLCSLLLAEIGWRVRPQATFYLLPFRAWELLAGSCLSLLSIRVQRDNNRSWSWIANPASLIGLALIAVSIFWFDETTPTPSLWLGIPITGAVLILAFAGPENFCGKLLSLWPVRAIGLVSYSAYLWHQPVIAFQNLQTFVDFGAWAKPLAVALSIALAWISWRYVESPFRTESRIKSPFTASATALGGLAIVAIALLIMQHSAPQKLPAYIVGEKLAGQEVVEYSEWGRENAKAVCNSNIAGEPYIRSCRLGVARREDDIILWGDSYAGALHYGLDKVARSRGLAGTSYFIPGCPPIVGLSRAAASACTSSAHRIILEHISRQPGHAIVILFGNFKSLAKDGGMMIGQQRSSLALAVRQTRYAREVISRSGKTLVFVDQGPRFDRDIARYYLRDRVMGNRNELFVGRADRDSDERIYEKFGDVSDVHIRTTELFCNQINCPARDADGHLIVWDHDHVTNIYSEKLANFILNTIPYGVKRPNRAPFVPTPLQYSPPSSAMVPSSK